MSRITPAIDPFRGTIPASIYQYLDKTGDGTGDTNAIEDYSGAGLGSTDFKIVPAPGEIMRIERMIIAIVAMNATSQDSYGGLGILSNGITTKKKNAGGDIQDLTAGIPITTQAQWAHLCFDSFQPDPGMGNDHVLYRWRFMQAGTPVRLVGDNGEFLAVTINDDMTGLLQHVFNVQGHFEGARV